MMSFGSMGGGANMRAPYRWRLRAARKRQGLRGTNVGGDSSVFLGDGDQRDASFDKPMMKVFLRATKVVPHPELVEGRIALIPVTQKDRRIAPDIRAS